jgi:hypothetical protein
MNASMRRRIAAASVAAVVIWGMTACTGSPGDGGISASGIPKSSDEPGDEGQSTSDACALIQESIEKATDEFESAPSDDPGAVVESMKQAAQRIAELSPQITNDEVAAIVPALQAMFAEAGEVMDAVARGDLSQVDDLSELGTTFHQTSEAFQEICEP